jgi:hypothetical protein
LELAHQFGPLGLCEKHGLPLCHGSNGEGDENPNLKSPHLAAEGLGANICPPRLEPDVMKNGLPVYSEPIEGWRGWARRAVAQQLLHDELRHGGLGQSELWTQAAGPSFKPPTNRQDATVQLISLFEIWRWAADVRLKMGCDPDGTLRSWPVSFTSTFVTTDGLINQSIGYLGGLFGFIGIHLMLAPAPGVGIAKCDGCPRVYWLKRKPRSEPDATGRTPEHFCPNCRTRGTRVTHWKRGRRAASNAHAEARKSGPEPDEPFDFDGPDTSGQ